jgi:hypothetical protein
MLLLTPPHGWPGGYEMSLRREEMQPLRVGCLQLVLLCHSCWPPAIPKIISCLRASGRYDCRVMHGIWKMRRQLADDLRPFGISVSFSEGPFGAPLRG